VPNQVTYHAILSQCHAHNAALVVVSKMRPMEAVMEIYAMGQRHFAENKVQELLLKSEQMPSDVEWHIIGHLQTNKVKDIVPVVRLIQSLDSLKLWEKINAECASLSIRMDCLLQIKIAQEETKYGWGFEDLKNTMKQKSHTAFPNVRIRGVMGMATLTDDDTIIRSEMKLLKSHFDFLKKEFYPDELSFDTISMGMSGDYQIALEEGSTMVRIGSLLFE
jgi:pyridoxal phosphate enzyme (YggS family)